MRLPNIPPCVLLIFFGLCGSQNRCAGTGCVLLTEGRRLSRMAETSWDGVREREGRETIVLWGWSFGSDIVSDADGINELADVGRSSAHRSDPKRL